MFDWSLISVVTLQKFFLIATRFGALFLSAPVLGSGQIPARTRIAIAMVISLLLFPIVKVVPDRLPCDLDVYAVFLFTEMLIGLVIGLITMIILNGILLAGQVIDMQMGFAIVSVIDPISNVQIPITGQVYYVLAILIFLAINGHHALILALTKSYNVIPLTGFTYSDNLIKEIIRISAHAWSIGFKIGAPVIAALFLTSVSLGIIARTVPQMNIFMVGFPIKIGLGLLAVGLSLEYFGFFVQEFFDMMFKDVKVLVRLMGG